MNVHMLSAKKSHHASKGVPRLLRVMTGASLLCVMPVSAARAQAPEAARVQSSINAGITWLLENQVKEGQKAGSWESARYDSAAASLAGLALLANGYRPGVGEAGGAIDRAMAFVQKSMTSDGYLGAADQQMYVHAICSLFGLAYLGTADRPETEKELAEWCRKSIALISRAQQVRKAPIDRGGWRYSPDDTSSDVSVTSWMLLVLHAARQCGFEVDPKTVDAGMSYLNQAFDVQTRVIRDAGGKAVDTRELRGYLYRPGASLEPERGATGAALFIKSLIEGGLDERSKSVLPFLTELPPSWEGDWHNGYFFFAAFYLTQGMFQIGGEAWEDFDALMKSELLAHQDGDGKWSFPGSNKPQSRQAGYAYSTAMAILILSLEKQYLPMYQRQSELF